MNALAATYNVFQRLPLTYGVYVDGRLIGEPFSNHLMADAYADELHYQAPWTVVEVRGGY